MSREARPLFATEWRYDLNGNVRQRNDSLSGKEFFSHDVMDRLTEHVDVLGRITNFVYDAAGNRLREDISGSGDDWQCYGRVEEERLVTLEHWYNRNGQLVKRKRRTPYLWSPKVISESLAWDVNGRLIALKSDSATTQYGYDGLGRRVFKKTTKAGEETARLTWFWWDGDALAGEAQETAPAQETLTAACDMQRPGSSEARSAHLKRLLTGQAVQEYVYYPQSFEPLALTGYGRRWSEKDGFSEPEKRTYFYHNDVNGAPMRLTDERGGVVWSQSAGPWGAWSEQTGSVRNPLRFQGQYFDEESGLHYNRYRYYEPESGRYISADPIGLAGGLNLYQYAPNPLSYIDPLGLARDLSGNDASGRPLSSPNYSVWYQIDIPIDIQSGTREQHFRNANQQLYEAIQKSPSLANTLPPEVVAHVQPGPLGGFKDTSPPNHSWHHQAQNPVKIELIPRSQHKAPGPVQGSLHPNQQGGYKKLGGKCG
ncbi:RHS domain-containing protein [Salmonella enterica subsp. enterica]